MKYGIIPVELITPTIALLFDVVTSGFDFDKVLESTNVTDKQGQEQQVKTKWITFKIVEFVEGDTIAENTVLQAKTDFNAIKPDLQIDFDVVFTHSEFLSFSSN